MQAELCAHLVLAGCRSQQATTQAKPKKRPRDRTKQLILRTPANVTKSAEHACNTQRSMQPRKEERGSPYPDHADVHDCIRRPDFEAQHCEAVSPAKAVSKSFMPRR